VFSFRQSMKLNASMPPSVMRANCACASRAAAPAPR
jgi:hypothetical protein